MAYNLETYQEPFWAKSGNFVRGRDPLGVQNSSISVYATLLPGMTNLTLRLRYYGTYLWLLDEYHNLPNSSPFKQSPNAQYTFIRRAELIIAFLMANKYPQEQSVIGINYATKHISEIKDLGYYDLALGADKNETTKDDTDLYWDYPSGALGQYYAGSLLSLNLMEARNGYFERTEEKGIELAEAYKKSLSSETASLFLKRIKEGKLYIEDLDGLAEVALNRDYKNTPEGQFYINMLLSNDGSKSKTASNIVTSQRKESFQLFMNLIHETEDVKEWLNLPVSSYKTCLLHSKGEVTEATFGWYYYYLNELAHYSLEAVFWGLLMEMDKGSYSLQQFLTYITKQVCDYCFESLGDKMLLPIKSLIQQLDKDEFKTLDYILAIDLSVKNKESIIGVAQGVFMALCLYRDNKHKLQEAKDYSIDHFLDTKNGNALAIFHTYIESNETLNFEVFVRNVVHNLLNEHIAIAYNKMGNGEKNLLKFVLEDNYLVHIETMQPNFTNPRLRTLYNFTRDLDLVDADSKLTTSGKELLNQLNS